MLSAYCALEPHFSHSYQVLNRLLQLLHIYIVAFPLLNIFALLQFGGSRATGDSRCDHPSAWPNPRGDLVLVLPRRIARELFGGAFWWSVRFATGIPWARHRDSGASPCTFTSHPLSLQQVIAPRGHLFGGTKLSTTLDILTNHQLVAQATTPCLSTCSVDRSLLDSTHHTL